MSQAVSFEPLLIERVFTGAGSMSLLAGELDRQGVGRAVLLTGRTLGAGALVDRVRAAAGDRLVADFAGVAAHNPTSSVEAATTAFREAGADGIIAFGGGSVVDCAKAVAWATRGDAAFSSVPITDVATTLSGAEFACSYGQTDDQTRRKGGWRDPSLFARAVFLDPDMTAETPAWLWYATGFRAIDHAVESFLAVNAHPYVDTLALAAVRRLCGFPSDLVESHHFDGEEPGGEDGQSDLRARCFTAAWMAHSGSLHINWGLSHQMGRQLGPAFGIPHGYTSSILLPPVVERELGGRPEAAAALEDAAMLARGESFAGRLRHLATRMRLPTSLREAGITDRALVEQLFAGNEAALEVVAAAW